jgi:general secretion pathway protein D
VHRATLLQAGRLEEALTLFEEAVRIDSSRPIATQQVLNTRNMIQQARGNRAESASPSGPELSPDILDAQGPVKLNGVSNLPVTLKLSQDTKIVYQTIGQLAGINVLFDPDITSRQLNIELNGVTLQEASLKIGQRVPTATGSFQSGISGFGVSGLVNTQFQYIDVGVNVDITPHIHPDGDITLKIALDVSSVINNQPIGGINEPVIGQRKLEHEIRLKDGEVSLLGGMLQQQDAQSQTGIPGLSQIPILKYLFSQKNTEVMDSEIVFVVIPHIVRRKDLNEFNERSLDVGTANSIHLRHAPGAIPNLESDNGSETISATKPSGETSAAFEFDPTAI